MYHLETPGGGTSWWAGLTVALIYVDSKGISSRYARKGLISDSRARRVITIFQTVLLRCTCTEAVSTLPERNLEDAKKAEVNYIARIEAWHAGRRADEKFFTYAASLEPHLNSLCRRRVERINYKMRSSRRRWWRLR